MVRKVNKGLSLVEVIIALAIFMLMMVPIVSSLISSMKTTGIAKELQSRNEYAQNLIETMKELPINMLETSSTSGIAYFEKIGAESVSITHTPGTKTIGADTYAYDKHVIAGKTYLGVERTKYSYVVEMSSEAYAVTNSVKSGVVQNLDQNEVALIGATLSNYDTLAYKELLKKKLLEAKKKQEGAGGTYDPAAAANLFKDDTGNRNIEIELKKDASDEYDVICTVCYSDNCTVASSSPSSSIGEEVGRVEYTVYTKHFKKLPDIYLMYNVGVYNDQYTNEYITYNTSGLSATEEVNVFVVETAADYSQDVADAASGTDWLKGGTDGLYQKAGGTDRDSVTIKMAKKNSVSSGKLRVYCNMGSSSADPAASNKKNIDVQEGEASEVYKWFGKADYIGVNDFQSLNDAQDGNRGLYEIKVWMQEGDNVDTSKNPILQGTRGGGKID